MAMSINGTMTPRKLKIPSRYAGLSGSFVTSGHSRTSSTSSTGRQKRSRPLRNTQYWDSGVRWTLASIASRSSPSSASGGIGASWKSSFMRVFFSCSDEAANRPQKLFSCERLGHIPIGALLLAPVAVAGGVLGGHENHRNGVELRMAFELAANLEAIA